MLEWCIYAHSLQHLFIIHLSLALKTLGSGCYSSEDAKDALTKSQNILKALSKYILVIGWFTTYKPQHIDQVDADLRIALRYRLRSGGGLAACMISKQ